MSDQVHFYFDFSSPYSYFAAQKIDRVIETCDRTVSWKPFLLGALFKITGSRPLTTIPMKDEYCLKDWKRLGEMTNTAWTVPDPFPISTQNAGRVFYWLLDQDPEMAKKFALAVFDTYFGRGICVTDQNIVIKIAGGVGADTLSLSKAMQTEKIKERFKQETQAAIDAGVFGAPFFIVDGESFWGSDRIWMIKRWLKGQTA